MNVLSAKLFLDHKLSNTLLFFFSKYNAIPSDTWCNNDFNDHYDSIKFWHNITVATITVN